MTTQPVGPARLFFDEVETVRGLGALSVIYGHYLSIVFSNPMDIFKAVYAEPSFSEAVKKALYFVYDNNAAVVMFFVISGLVLGHSLDVRARDFHENPLSPAGYVGFVWRRIFRIYPAYIVVVIAMLIQYQVTLALYGASNPAVVSWFQDALPPPVWWHVLENMALFWRTLVPIAWTVQIEMLACFIFPLIYAASRRRSLIWDGAMVALFCAIALYYHYHDGYKCLLACWTFSFYIGLLVATRGEAAMKFLKARGLSGDAVLILGYLLLVLPGVVVDGRPVKLICIESVAGFLILAPLVWGAKGRIARVLNTPLLRTNGRISYSLYLWAIPASALTDWIQRGLGVDLSHEVVPIAKFLIEFPAVLLLAWFFALFSYRWIERPFMRWGSRFAPRFGALRKPPIKDPISSAVLP